MLLLKQTVGKQLPNLKGSFIIRKMRNVRFVKTYSDQILGFQKR